MKRTVFQLLMVGCLLMSCVASPALVSDFVVAQGGQTAYQIVLSQVPSEVETFAALELQKYLGRMSGAHFPLRGPAQSGHRILIGSASLAGTVNRAALGFDGFVYQAQPGLIVLAGVTDRATLFAVYAFLIEK